MSDFVTGLLIGQAAGLREAENNTPRESIPPSGTFELLGELTDAVESLREENRLSRAAAAGKDAVRRRLVEALAEVAPNHPLASPVENNALRDAIYDEAWQREYDRNTPGAYDL